MVVEAGLSHLSLSNNLVDTGSLLALLIKQPRRYLQNPHPGITLFLRLTHNATITQTDWSVNALFKKTQKL